MSQIVKMIDVSKSFTVIDPNAFMQNMGFTKQGDAPDETAPILAYEGYNFLPTSYGYRSYFGTTSTLAMPALASKCDKVLFYQLANLRNVAIALCEDGIWVSNTAANAWTHLVTLSVPTPAGTYKEYTNALIANELYVYRAGESSVWKFTPTGYHVTTLEIEVVTIASTYGTTPVALDPTKFSPFINVAGQQGIFRAATSLAFWQDNGTVTWSSFDDPTNFEINPSDNSIYFGSDAYFTQSSALIGKIVTVLPQGDNFVAYCTKSIIGFKMDLTAAILFEGQSISDMAGIAYSKLVTRGISDLEHYAYTNIGIKKIGSYNAVSRSHAFETVLPDIYDFLKESKTPVFMNLLNGRFLTFSLVNSNYIDGIVGVSSQNLSPYTFSLTINGTPWDGVHVPEIDSLRDYLVLAPWSFHCFTQWRVGLGLSYSAASIPSTNAIQAMMQADGPLIGSPGTLETITANAATDGAWVHVRAATSASTGAADGTQAANISANIGKVNSYNAGCTNLIAAYTGAGSVLVTPNPVHEPIPMSDISSGAWYTSNGYALVAVNAQAWSSWAKAPTNNALGSLPAPNYSTTVTNPTPGAYNAVDKSVYTFVNNTSVVLVSSYATPTVEVSAIPVPNTGTYAVAYIQFDYFGNGGLGTTAVGTSNLTGAAGEAEAYANAYASLFGMAPSNIGETGWGGNTPGGGNKSFLSGGLIYYVAFVTGVGNVNVPGYGIGVGATGALAGYKVTEHITKSLTLTTAAGSAHKTIEIGSTQTVLNAGTVSLSAPAAWTIPPIEIVNSVTPIPSITLPGSTFSLQNGSLAPYYPDFYGALVFDMSLKKWGKMKGTHKALIDYFPMNTADSPISYTNFGMEAGLITPTYTMKLFDSVPTDSKMKWGKFGFLRGGFTKLEEVIAHFRVNSTGNITVRSSLDGRAEEVTLSTASSISAVGEFRGFYNQTGVWHTLEISGQWDLQYLEFRGRIAGKR